MKEITEERTKVEKYTVYQAVDGTEFDSQKECEEYEKSARGVLRGKLKPLIVNDQYDEWELLRGNEDNHVLAIKMCSMEDVDTVLQNYYLDNPWILEKDCSSSKDKVTKAINQAYKEHDVLLLGLNFEDCLYLIDTRNNLINRLNNLDKKEEDK